MNDNFSSSQDLLPNLLLLMKTRLKLHANVKWIAAPVGLLLGKKFLLLSVIPFNDLKFIKHNILRYFLMIFIKFGQKSHKIVLKIQNPSSRPGLTFKYMILLRHLSKKHFYLRVKVVTNVYKNISRCQCRLSLTSSTQISFHVVQEDRFNNLSWSRLHIISI